MGREQHRGQAVGVGEEAVAFTQAHGGIGGDQATGEGRAAAGEVQPAGRIEAQGGFQQRALEGEGGQFGTVEAGSQPVARLSGDDEGAGLAEVGRLRQVPPPHGRVVSVEQTRQEDCAGDVEKLHNGGIVRGFLASKRKMSLYVYPLHIQRSAGVGSGSGRVNHGPR